MGRYDLRAQRVLAKASLAVEAKRIPTAPIWHQVVQDVPPPPRLNRPVLQRHARRKYQPEQIRYPEDELRTEFFSDHPWELARPKVLVENSGNDHRDYDWSEIEQEGKRMDGESVVQRQLWLKENGKDESGKPLSHYRAYDIARKEFYAHRHFEDVERRIAKEEALHTGAYFNIGPNRIAEPLENRKFDRWKLWAARRVNLVKNLRLAGYSGSEVDEDDESAAAVMEAEAEVEGGDDQAAEELPWSSQESMADAVENTESDRR